MSVKFTDNTPAIISHTSKNSSAFLREMMDKIDSESQGRTPKKTGALRRNILKQVLGNHGKIAWQQPYASYQEDIQHKNYTTSNTGPHYAERAVMKVVRDSDVIAKRIFK